MACPHPRIGPPDGIERRFRPHCTGYAASGADGSATGPSLTRVRTTDLPLFRRFPRFIASIAPCCFHHAACAVASAVDAAGGLQSLFVEAARRDVMYFFSPEIGRLDQALRVEATAAAERIIGDAFQREKERATARIGTAAPRSSGLAIIADAVGEAIMEKNFQIWAREEELHQMRAALRRSVLAGMRFSTADLAALDHCRYRALMEEVQAEVEHRLRVARSNAAINGFGTA
jgi:hypothetical protein